MHCVGKASNFFALNLVKHPVTTELSVTKLEDEHRAADVIRSESIIPFHMLSLWKNDASMRTEKCETVMHVSYLAQFTVTSLKMCNKSPTSLWQPWNDVLFYIPKSYGRFQ